MQPGQHITSTLRLVRLIGKGGMGSVWVADHLALATQVAVKFMSSSFVENQALVQRFRTEAMAAAQIKSPHVAQVFDHGIMSDGTPYIVMELLEGEDLKRRIRREGPLPLRDVSQIIAQACKALGRAHQLGIVHRDIKPDNIFLCNMDGETFVKLLDFGIAKLGPDNALGATTTGSMMGTPLYMSPEQLLSAKRVDFRSDLWSLGVVAYHAVTGRVPFNGETVGSLSVAVHTGSFVLPSAVRQGVPPSLDAWFLRALRRDQNERFGSARELAEALDAAVNGGAQSAMRPYQDSAMFRQAQLMPPPSGPISVGSGAPGHTPPIGGSSPGMQGPTLVGTATTAARTTSGKPTLLIGAVAGVLVLGAVGAVAIVSAGNKGTDAPQAPAAAAHAPETPPTPTPASTPAPASTPVVAPVSAAPTSSAVAALATTTPAAPNAASTATSNKPKAGPPPAQTTAKPASTTKKKSDDIGF
ncbi:serine/threonine-protein kinase [Polyangium aurulentum]|uniref:serine/threonine-protein kinase n=1 Tax=Polyangium aurulentum TaxID=2567896 RepID=UPI0010ADCDB4|nr:serine/threonine-protein kinase [Polyangium aurulentum]UQA57649.1 protein kinase [Polyangium aurulentum]